MKAKIKPNISRGRDGYSIGTMMISTDRKRRLRSNSAVSARNFFAELKRRDVYKVAVAYIVAGWALAEGIAQVFPMFDVPTCAIRLIIILMILGFPVAVVLAWAFDITPEGIRRTTDPSPDEALDMARQLEARDRQQFVRGYLYALVYAGLGDKTKAIDYLTRDYHNHDNIDTTAIPVDPVLDSLNCDPRFETSALDLTPSITGPRSDTRPPRELPNRRHFIEASLASPEK